MEEKAVLVGDYTVVGYRMSRRLIIHPPYFGARGLQINVIQLSRDEGIITPDGSLSFPADGMHHIGTVNPEAERLVVRRKYTTMALTDEEREMVEDYRRECNKHGH